MSKSVTSEQTPSSYSTIREIATKKFSEIGYSVTTMRDIATEVGILPGSLYAHITSKEALLFEIIDAGIGRFLAAAEDVRTAADSPDGRLRIAIVRHLQVVGESPGRTMVVFHQWRYLSGDFRERIIAKRRAYEDIFAELIGEGMASGVFSPVINPRIAVLGILGALNWSAEWFSPQGSSTAEQVGGSLADYLINGILDGGPVRPAVQVRQEPDAGAD